MAIDAVYDAGLQIIYNRLPETCDRKTKDGDRIYVRYSGAIDASSKSGTPNSVFDSNLNKASPFEVYLGKGTVIKGWDLGLLDMCVGEKRTLVIQPELGYGSRGFGRAIPKGGLQNI
jgi:FKBP-type peptidyl-prolyl cis-trans isomerase